MDIFEKLQEINEFLESGDEQSARNDLIFLLDEIQGKESEHPEILNHMIRRTGLYPYLDIDTANWDDRFAFEAFKVNTGAPEPLTLHREQSFLLKKLLSGESIAVSAPTSFGKSFVVDAFIAIKKPKNVVLIVPTIALTDETRRRIQRKFGNEYKVITTTDVDLADKNILIFPQERAINYVNVLEELDLLIIDEFYKASEKFDKERSTPLLKAILKLGEKAQQRYFLAPNISAMDDNPFTEGMEFIPLDFNTVYLRKHEYFKDGALTPERKNEIMTEVLSGTDDKTLVYVSSYTDINTVSGHLLGVLPDLTRSLPNTFADWLAKNYQADWNLVSLVRKGVGVHNGQLHRSLSQLQIKLYELEQGLDTLVSTSSIIEGVNTSAKNVVIWKNKNGNSRLNDFSFKNIMGRGGRMFKHFIGDIHILETPPAAEETQLDLGFPDNLLADVDEDQYREELTPEQIAKIIEYKESMTGYMGSENFEKVQSENSFQTSDHNLLRSIAASMQSNPQRWKNLRNLNNPPQYWGNIIFDVLRLRGGSWGVNYTDFVNFTKLATYNWQRPVSEQLSEMSNYGIEINKFFELERRVTFNLSSLLGDINVMQASIIGDAANDISPFIAKTSNAFLPPLVYQLEEYGLPRMISKKVHQSEVIEMENTQAALHDVLQQFLEIGQENLISKVKDLDEFDRFVLGYFYSGILSE